MKRNVKKLSLLLGALIFAFGVMGQTQNNPERKINTITPLKAEKLALFQEAVLKYNVEQKRLENIKQNRYIEKKVIEQPKKLQVNE